MIHYTETEQKATLLQTAELIRVQVPYDDRDTDRSTLDEVRVFVAAAVLEWTVTVDHSSPCHTRTLKNENRQSSARASCVLCEGQDFFATPYFHHRQHQQLTQQLPSSSIKVVTTYTNHGHRNNINHGKAWPARYCHF